MALRFEGKTAIVTGAGSGIGRAVALKLGSEGASVVLADRHEDGIQAVAAGMPTAVAIAADVATEAGCAAIVATAMDSFGTIDVVHANAGVMSEMRNVVDSDPADFDRVMAVNSRGVYLTLRAVLPELIRKRAGAVVVTSSVGAFSGSAGVAPYIASKHAALGLVRSVAREVAGYGVRVNAVCPGTTNTALNHDLHEMAERGELEEYREQLQGSSIPLRRVGQPEDVANLVAWLLCDEAGYVTGSSHVVDGGFSA